MNTKAWGGKLWFFLGCTVANFEPTPEKIYHTKQFFESLCYLLPCRYCCESYKQFTRKIPIDNYLHSREALQYWLYLIHNEVNNKLRRQGKSIPPDPSFKSVCAYYEQFRAKCNPKTMSCNIPLTKKDRKQMKKSNHISF